MYPTEISSAIPAIGIRIAISNGMKMFNQLMEMLPGPTEMNDQQRVQKRISSSDIYNRPVDIYSESSKTNKIPPRINGKRADINTPAEKRSRKRRM